VTDMASNGLTSTPDARSSSQPAELSLSDHRMSLQPVFWMKIQLIESPGRKKIPRGFRVLEMSALRAAHETAARDAGDAYESRAEQ
jgi:hypothetical protein